MLRFLGRKFLKPKRYGGKSSVQSKGRKRRASAPLSRPSKRMRLSLSSPPRRSRTRTKTGKRSRTPAPKFNTGYTITNMKARNTAKRSMRHRRVSGRDIAKALMARVSYNNYRINEIETGLGAVLLPNYCYGTGGTFPASTFTQNYCPLHIYTLDTTSVTSGVSTAPSAWQLYHVKDTAAEPDASYYAFENKLYLRNTNEGPNETSTTPAYVYGACNSTQWENDADVVTVGTKKRKWFQKNVSCEMVMYGQTNQDTLYRVDVIQMDARFAEAFSRSTVFPSAQITHLNEWNQFWHSLVAPYTQNPMHKPMRQMSNIKIVKSFKFKIPEQSADFDRVPCVKTRFNVSLNRVIDRFWKRGAESDAVLPNDPENAAQMNDPTADSYKIAEADQGFVDPKKRYFLMVRATNNDRGALINGFQSSLTRTSGQDPTYDIKLRSQYLVDI